MRLHYVVGGGSRDAEDSGGDWIQRGRWDYVVGLVGKPSAGEGESVSQWVAVKLGERV